MQVKDCSNCYWNYKNICENTNWKTGVGIPDVTKPECGYFLISSKTPLGFMKKATLTTGTTHQVTAMPSHMTSQEV